MKVFTGQVIAKLDEKTAKVKVAEFIAHPIYKKRFKREKVYLVHDNAGVKVGETVKFTASKPYSRMKKWRIIK